eukprot:gene2450-8563_t
MAVPEATVVAPVGLWPTRREGCLNFSVPEAASAEELFMAVPKATVVAPVGLWPTRREGCLNFSVPEAASAEEAAAGAVPPKKEFKFSLDSALVGLTAAQSAAGAVPPKKEFKFSLDIALAGLTAAQLNSNAVQIIRQSIALFAKVPLKYIVVTEGSLPFSFPGGWRGRVTGVSGGTPPPLWPSTTPALRRGGCGSPKRFGPRGTLGIGGGGLAAALRKEDGPEGAWWEGASRGSDTPVVEVSPPASQGLHLDHINPHDDVRSQLHELRRSIDLHTLSGAKPPGNTPGKPPGKPPGNTPGDHLIAGAEGLAGSAVSGDGLRLPEVDNSRKPRGKAWQHTIATATIHSSNYEIGQRQLSQHSFSLRGFGQHASVYTASENVDPVNVDSVNVDSVNTHSVNVDSVNAGEEAGETESFGSEGFRSLLQTGSVVFATEVSGYTTDEGSRAGIQALQTALDNGDFVNEAVVVVLETEVSGYTTEEGSRAGCKAIADCLDKEDFVNELVVVGFGSLLQTGFVVFATKVSGYTTEGGSRAGMQALQSALDNVDFVNEAVVVVFATEVSGYSTEEGSRTGMQALHTALDNG